MSTVIDNAKAAFTDINLMHLQDIVETICNHALARAYPPFPSRKKLELEELLHDSTFVERFRVGLMQGAAYLLAASDERVLAVYRVGNPGVPTRVKTNTAEAAKTHLLILVSNRSAALNALAIALDQALIREVGKLSPKLQHEQKSLLNPIFITEADVVQNKGYAMLLSAALAPPLTIWQRDDT
ncbi:MAG: hypothetical protein CL608_20550 [Anaerolineaceae bacterium]|nr:hypothetical protein [Anaerolineaceae bacterium]